MMTRGENSTPGTLLITGGAGYIGSHACVAFMDAGYEVVVLDNLSNSSEKVLERVSELAGKKPAFIHGDIRDRTVLRECFARYQPNAVIHFAGLKAVGESVMFPERYHDNNVEGTAMLLEAMDVCNTDRLVFSSSATVYGMPDAVPVSESHPLVANSPYGQNKIDIEHMIQSHCTSNKDFSAMCLRYFNPVGAHESGRLGEAPSGVPNNLMPFLSQVATGRRENLHVFGNDYPTRDGTGVRDYIHVMDLVEGHLAALALLEGEGGFHQVNLGTGQGYSVLELLRAYEEACGHSIPFKFDGRREGDVAEVWADPSLAGSLLSWQARRGLLEMCVDAWRWESLNPAGYC